tara:strand:+ start:1849 stop:2892 length:1044 start_codon:yes stop_codon:yes gene_type:complete
MKKLKVIDLFCGSGGFTLGFLSEKFNVDLAVDFDPYCGKVYKKNLPKIKFILKDLSNLDKKIFEGLKPDIVVGGPPCQGFSTIGSRISSQEKKRRKKDIRNNLVFSFIEHVNYLNPKIFLMENVSGILTRESGDIFSELKKKIKSYGYKFDIYNLDAVNYGVPQYRKRVFIVGTKLDNYEISKPNITHGDHFLLEKEITVNSVIRDLAKIKIDESLNHVPLKHKPKNLKRYALIPEGGRLPENNLPKELFRKNFGNTFKRLHRNKPSLTMVPGHNAFPIHPWLDRSLTVREAARIQTYPDNFIFIGPRHQQCIQVGNSVPVKLAKHWAKHLKKTLLKKDTNKNEKAA